MLQRSVLARMLVMGVLLVVLMIPLAMTQGVITERASRRDEVSRDISRTWGDRQVVTGPVLSVPYRHVVREERVGEAAARESVRTGHLVLLPEQLDVEGRLDPETRARGPFSAVVYTARLTLRGQFGVPDTSVVSGAGVTFLWDQATVSLGISDPQGIASRLRFVWAGSEARVIPGVDDTGLSAAGVQTHVVASADAPTTFEIGLDLRGTRALDIVPVGNETTMRLTSAWPHPGFSGGQLPAEHRVTSEGFEARWQAAWFARGFPAAWVRGDIDSRALQAQATASALGLALVQPVDVYQQAERAVKYAALFIVLTLAVAFVREVTSQEVVHPVQYLFVGFGLCLFYLLLVSLAEHIRFDVAYLAAASATVALLSWYWSGVLRGGRRGVTMGVALTALYGYLYLLLRLEDLALVAGATGLFVMLAVVMAMTRHVNWFALRLGAAR
jgi:inner membrane protein